MSATSVTWAEQREIDEAPPNDMQLSLAEAAIRLPAGAAGIPDDGEEAFEAAHFRESRPPATAREAREQALRGVGRFLRGPGFSPDSID